MKRLFIIIWPSLLVSLCAAQGTFGNLNFERGKLVLVPEDPAYVYADQALPGWRVYTYGEATMIFYNEISLGAARVGIHDSYSPSSVFVPVLQGKYSLFFQPETDGDPAPYITQTSILPSWGASIRFLTASESEPGFSVSLNGMPLDVVPLHEQRYNGYVWGANFDISDYGNEEVELRIGGSGVLDNIFFSSSVIPEPSAWSLILLGVGAIAWCRKK